MTATILTPIKVGNYDYMDQRDPSFDPPTVLQVPQFISIGFDDFPKLEAGQKFILGLPNKARFSFYLNNQYPTGVELIANYKSLHEAFILNHEIGNHTLHHGYGSKFNTKYWETEIEECNRWLIKPYNPKAKPEDQGIGVELIDIFGFRAPFLNYNDTLFSVLKNAGFMYDCSIQEGWQYNQDGTNFLWPYTLDHGSPGNATTSEDFLTFLVKSHPGLWELPSYPVIVPPDSKCQDYGVPVGLRKKLAETKSTFDIKNGKITGFDWNMWVDYNMTRQEFLATMKYTLDLRITGNRCPFIFGAHSDIYSDKYQNIKSSTFIERQDALIEFIQYALNTPTVKIVSAKELLNWLQEPISY